MKYFVVFLIICIMAGLLLNYFEHKDNNKNSNALLSIVRTNVNKIILVEAFGSSVEITYEDEFGINRRVSKGYQTVGGSFNSLDDHIRIVKEIHKYLPEGKFQYIERNHRVVLKKYKHIELKEQYGENYILEIENIARNKFSELMKSNRNVINVCYSYQDCTDYFDIETKINSKIIRPTKYLSDIIEAMDKIALSEKIYLEYIMLNETKEGEIIKCSYNEMPYVYKGNMYEDLKLELLVRKK